MKVIGSVIDHSKHRLPVNVGGHEIIFIKTNKTGMDGQVVQKCSGYLRYSGKLFRNVTFPCTSLLSVRAAQGVIVNVFMFRMFILNDWSNGTFHNYSCENFFIV